jgi:hypothetical protein
MTDPHGVTDDLRWKTVSAVTCGWRIRN